MENYNKTVTISADWDSVEFVILDMDGTLLDLHFDDQVWNVLLPTRYGEKYAIDELAAIRLIGTYLNTQRGTLNWYCLDYWTEKLGIDINKLEFELSCLISMRPGTENFLDRLARADARLFLATNAHPKSLDLKLKRVPIGDYFERIVSAHDIGVPKEDIAFWAKFKERCGITLEKTLLIDDNHSVLRTAQRSGIGQTFGIARPNSQGRLITSSEFTCVEHFDNFITPSR